MNVQYAVSLWNYRHYANAQTLEQIIASVREQGFGIELWESVHDEKALFGEAQRKRLKSLLQGMPVSLHSAICFTPPMGEKLLDRHRRQIDAAHDLGAEIIVVHPLEIGSDGETTVDLALTREIIAYAADHNVRIALENIERPILPFLLTALQEVARLGICLDIGHVYFADDPLTRMLDALKDRITHLHIEDKPAESEARLNTTVNHHYQPGTGVIPNADWRLLAATLEEIDFHGMAVFEILPRNPLQAALQGKRFMEELLNGR